jgi:hypothetical protein
MASQERKHMKKARKSKVKTYTIAECNAELGEIRKNYKAVERGLRHELRMSLQRTQRVLRRLRLSEKLKNAYQRSVLDKRNNKCQGKEGAFDLSLEVVVQATGAASRIARQKASKQARVLDYLHELNVPTNDLRSSFHRAFGASLRRRTEHIRNSEAPTLYLGFADCGLQTRCLLS